MDPNGKSDPYCIITVGDLQEKTCVQYSTTNPEWREKLVFDVTGVPQLMQIEPGMCLPDNNPGQKYVVHPENSQCFHHCSLFDDENGSFSEIRPFPLPPFPFPFPLPSYNVASRGTLLAHWFNVVWAWWILGKIVRKGQVYHDFQPGL